MNYPLCEEPMRKDYCVDPHGEEIPCWICLECEITPFKNPLPRG